MAFNGSGTFNRVYDWSDDRDAGIKILATRMDTEDDGFATGLSTCITKDGQTTVTANLPMNSNRHTGVSNAAARTDYSATGQVQDSSFLYAADSGSSNTYSITLSPAVTAYAAGQIFHFKAANANSGASTLNVNSVGAKTIVKDVNTALASGDISQHEICSVIYDGTNFQMVGNADSEQVVTTYTNGTDNRVISSTGTAGINGEANLTFDGSTLAVTGAATVSGSLGVGTSINPDASDGATLGTTALEWSDLYLADGAQILFGDDQEVTLTHVADTGLLLNSTMQLQFNDASQYINAPSATVLDINATDEVEINATLCDVNANLDVSGTIVGGGAITGGGLMTTGGNIVIPNAGNIGSASDTDAMAISSGGVVAFSQVPTFPNDTIETADIQDNAVTLAKMAGLVRGKIIYGDASGNPAALTVGSANYILKSDGTDIAWAAAGGTTLSGSTNDTITTVTGANAIQGEANLKFTSSNVLEVTGTQTITTSAAGTALTITSSEAGAGSGPDIYLHRNSASPADDDVMGRVVFAGEDSAGNATEYASIEVIAKDITNSSEDGTMEFYTIQNGTKRSALSILADGTNAPDVIINKDNQYSDFFVETANAAQTLWVQGSSDKIGMNRTASMDANLNMCGNSTNSQCISFSHSSAEDTAVGSITVSSSATTYATSSDYRLKENVVDMENAVDRVKELKPYRFNFISDPSVTVDGFYAHEAGEVVPEAISGEKDAMREDDSSKIVPQGIDQSKLVPLLCGALQEAIARIEELESKVN